MRYPDTCRAIFIKRLNRFTALVRIGQSEETVHVKNTGRLGELFIEGAEVLLSHEPNPNRKTAYDLILVKKGNQGWVNVDSQAPNRIVAEWLLEKPYPFDDLLEIKPEFSYGNSRIDFMLRCNNRSVLMEVKGCTLERDGIGYFPDAPTLRGIRHLEGLSQACKEGWSAYLAFVIAVPSITKVLPNRATHPQFADALENAKASGVHILYLPCCISPDEIYVQKEGIICE